MSSLFYAKFPVPHHGIKKNSKQIAFNRATKKSFIRSSDKALFAQKWLAQKLLSEKIQQRLDTITDDINIKFTFYFPDSIYYTKQGIRSKKVADLSNLFELPNDVMQKVGIIENDSNVCSFNGSMRQPIKDNRCWLEIEITKI